MRRRPEQRAGVINNELQDIFAVVAPARIEDLRPSPAELEGIVAVPLVEAGRGLCEGGEATGIGLVVEGDQARFVEESIRGRELVPAADGYYRKAYASLAVMLSGGRPEAWGIG